jgi:hypothetical protein
VTGEVCQEVCWHDAWCLPAGGARHAHDVQLPACDGGLLNLTGLDGSFVFYYKQRSE